MIKNVIFLFILIIFFSCTSTPKSDFKDIIFSKKNVTSINVASTEILNICDSIVSPNSVLCIGDYLVINEFGPNGSFHTVDLKNGKYLGVFGNNGRGPGEMSMPATLTKDDNDNLYIFDIQQQKVVQYDIDSLLNKKKFQNEFKLKNLNGALAAIILKSKVYSLNSRKSDYRIYVSDMKGKDIEGLGALPNNFKNFPKNTFAEGHPAKIQYSNNILALCYLTTPLIQIFNMENKQWTTIGGPEEFLSIFETNNKAGMALAYTDKSRSGYLDIKISKKYIYALYSGKHIFGTTDFNSKTIYVFELNGTPIKKINLDKGLISFDVYNDKYIYGINLGMKIRLLKFKIK